MSGAQTDRSAHAARAALTRGFVAAVLALFVFAVLAEAVANSQTLVIDGAVLAWLSQLNIPALMTAALIVSLFGSQGVAVFLAILVIFLGFRRRWLTCVMALVVVGGAQLLNDILKDLFHRTRPAPVDTFLTAQTFSFPSGHAMVSAAFYGFVAYLAWPVLHRSLRNAAVAGLVLLVLAIGVARLYLADHWLSDVIAGYTAGFIWLDAVILARRQFLPEGQVSIEASSESSEAPG